MTQQLCKDWDMWDDHWDVETLRSARFTNRAQTQILTFEFHKLSGLNMSGLNTTLWYKLWQKSHKNDTGDYFLRDHFPPPVIKYHHTECNNPFVVVLRECSVLIFVEYDPKIPYPAYRVDIWNFTIFIQFLLTFSFGWMTFVPKIGIIEINSLVKPPLKLECWWVITSQYFIWII